ncbi:autotransporter assembly complex family protein [Ferrimonas pelagia]|uniref:Translocation and assembly module subunit TamA n=1 Tax=Ferrimonas pelagia TaxID=1177826 RepID=A0ABP9EKQ9_9GAMM
MQASGGLKLTLKGIKGNLADNVRAHLSPLPDSPATRASFLFSYQERVDEALQALGYYRAEVESDLQRTAGDWQLTLSITPGEPVRYNRVLVLIEGEARDDPVFQARLDAITIRPGDPVHHGRYLQLKADIISMGLVRGYLDGDMTQHRLEIDRDNNQADLLLLYQSGLRYRLGEVEFWASELNPDLLQKLVTFEPGTPYHSSEIGKLTNSLFSSGYFQDVKVLPHPARAVDGVIPIEAGLSPPPRHSFDVGIGYATDTRARLSTTWRTPVVNRHGHSQETKAELSELNPKLSFDYRIPIKHPLNDQLQLRASVGKEKFGDIDSTQYQGAVGRKTVTGGGWTRTLYLRYLSESWQQASLSPTADYILPGISFTHTQRSGPQLDPSAGFRQHYQLEHGEPFIRSDQRTTRFRGQLRMIATPWPKHRLSSRLELGFNLVDDDELLDLAPSLRFFAGGDQSIRGFGYQTLGPKAVVDEGEDTETTISVGGRYLLVGSVEYQYYLFERWRLAAFIDSGNAFDVYDSDAFKVVTSVGGGLHWISPIGPIRLDIGVGISESDNPWRLHITIGAEL